MRVEQLELSEWESALPSSGFEVFHLPEALRVVERHADGELRLFGGFKGQQPIALLAVFVERKSVGTAITSPPSGMGIPRLGPILMPTSPKRRKQEKVNNEFTEEVLEQIDADATPDFDQRLAAAGVESPLAETVIDRLDLNSRLTLFRMRCNGAYGDPRPYEWDGLRVGLDFTHVLDLDGRNPEAVRASFSDRHRQQIRKAEASDVTVEREGLSGAREVFRTTEEQRGERGESVPPSWAYVRELFEALASDGRARTYVARDSSGKYRSGRMVLYSNDGAYCWQGDAKVAPEATAADALVHWRVVEDVLEDPPVESVSQYDLLDGDPERLCRYETRFGADLVSSYVVESPGVAMTAAERVSQLVR